MNFGRPEIRFPFGQADFHRQALELPLADRSQVAAMVCGGGFFVEENRQHEFRRRGFRHLTRKIDGLCHADVLYGDEGHHIHCAHAGVLALVHAHVDGRDRRFHGFENCGSERTRLAHHRDDAAVVVLVALVVQELDTLPAPERLYDFFDLLQITSFAEVRDAFDDLGYTRH
jgi:hypothetical protein